MAIFKCKMCGGALEIQNNETVAACEYCGTQQTVPKLDDEKRVQMYDRANHFRRNNEFDKAMGIYEQILNEDSTDAEAYWSLVLCRYGIEYVEDPSSHKRVPTINRAQFTSVFDDDNYKSALNNADSYQKAVYEQEAKAINEIQKGILAISSQEEPFDVFICYKETDNNGRRTPDSVLATELYHELTRDGFKVFFSCITLEDKLGSAYEPYIFAALNSAKVMVVLGTKPEYFTAVWVKNEWSRYLSLIKNGAKKMLIPAYKDMDPYDLPEEFSHLQAQDMSKLGFMQDLIRGIKKIVQVDEGKTTVVKETVVASSNANAASWLERAFLFLEDGEWESADEYCEKVLDIDPKCAEAYLGKLMVELKVRQQQNLKNCSTPFNENNNYRKVLRFGDDELKHLLSEYIEHINRRNEETRRQAAQRAREEETRREQEEIQKKEQTMLMLADMRKRTSGLENAISRSSCAYAPFHAAIHSKGNVFVSGYDLYKRDMRMQTWDNVVRLSIGETHALGLRSDGTVFVCGDNKYGQCNVNKWKHVVEIAAGGFHSVGLRMDGTVVATGVNQLGECEVASWNDVVQIAAGKRHTVGLKKDGTVIAVGSQKDNRCDVSHWKNITKIFAFNGYTVGLKSDGTVKCTNQAFDVSRWKDIVDISMGWETMLGLKADGTVVATGSNEYGEGAVSNWQNIVAISTLNLHSVGLCADGTVVATGSNEYGESAVSNWKNIVAVSVGAFITLGVQKDGSIVSAGEIKAQPYNRLHDWKLFDDVTVYIEQQQEKYAHTKAEVQQKYMLESERRANHLCLHCGAPFKKSFFSEKCSSCGKSKDY